MPEGRQVKPLFKGSEIQLTADSGFQVTLQPHLLLLNLHSGPAYFSLVHSDQTYIMV